jgi:glucosamine--fructose-6-phosphate aminotransferase (isomerizing)
MLEPGTPVICVATSPHVADRLRANLAEVRARRAEVITVAAADAAAMAQPDETCFAMPSANPLLQPVLSVVPLQLLAYHVARRRGLDVDRPRNLAKTVTVE